MPSAPRTVVIGTRISADAKARLAALAAQRSLTESALLALLVDSVAPATAQIEQTGSSKGCDQARSARERVTLRLRPGDRERVDARAAARRMKTSSYLTMLVRNHVRSAAVMPCAEVDLLKATTGHLAALSRQLRLLTGSVDAAEGQSAEVRALLVDLGRTVESVREAVAGVVRLNLLSWETQEDGHA